METVVIYLLIAFWFVTIVIAVLNVEVLAPSPIVQVGLVLMGALAIGLAGVTASIAFLLLLLVSLVAVYMAFDRMDWWYGL